MWVKCFDVSCVGTGKFLMHLCTLAIDTHMCLPYTYHALHQQSTPLKDWERQLIFQLFFVQRWYFKRRLTGKGIGIIKLLSCCVVETYPCLYFCGGRSTFVCSASPSFRGRSVSPWGPLCTNVKASIFIRNRTQSRYITRRPAFPLCQHPSCTHRMCSQGELHQLKSWP